MKNIIIGKPTNKPKLTNCYKFVFNFMSGDADAYADYEVVVKKDNPYLEEFTDDVIEFFKKRTYTQRYNNADSSLSKWVDGSNDNPSNVYSNGIYNLYNKGEVSKSFYEEMEEKVIYIEWEHDITTNDYASLEECTVFYYDENGVEYEAKFDTDT